jgi:hypothetical protein
VTLQSLPIAHSASHDSRQLRSHELFTPQSKLHDEPQSICVHDAPALHAQLLPVQGQAGPGHTETGPPEQPATQKRTRNANEANLVMDESVPQVAGVAKPATVPKVLLAFAP